MSQPRPPRGRVPPARRRRALTEEEARVWQGFVAAAGIVPLRPGEAPAEPAPEAEAQREAPTQPAGAAPAAPVAPAAPAAPVAPVAPAAPVASVVPAPPPELAIGVAPAGLDRRRWEALRRGRLAPERTLDLHGRRVEEAHRAVVAFVAAAEAEGLRCIAIVTGKGSGETGGVLRRELPHWLNAAPLRGMILALAHPHRANTGAVYVLLRRRRG
jgi:DNA-nicking Smr family endonuclease